MLSLSLLVILLQRINPRQSSLGFGRIHPAQTGKQALFLIGGVPRRGFTEIPQAGLERRTLLGPQRLPLRLLCDRDQRLQKALDAPVAVRQHSDRIRKIAFARRADSDRHRGSSFFILRFLTKPAEKLVKLDKVRWRKG